MRIQELGDSRKEEGTGAGNREGLDLQAVYS